MSSISLNPMEIMKGMKTGDNIAEAITAIQASAIGSLYRPAATDHVSSSTTTQFSDAANKFQAQIDESGARLENLNSLVNAFAQQEQENTDSTIAQLGGIL